MTSSARGVVSSITNLMVLDVASSIRFYCDVIGCDIAFVVDGSQATFTDGSIPTDAVFASVRAGATELMLQDRVNLAADAPMVTVDTEPHATMTIYFRVEDVDAVVARLDAAVGAGDLPATDVVKPLEVTWYGMKEIWVRDPDGYVVTVGTPHGPPPQ